MTTAVESPQFIRTIEWDMMDKSKFFPLSMLSTFSVRCVLYPLTVIKTRLQVQRHDQITFQIVSGVFYISTYEGVRHMLTRHDADTRVKSLVAGGCASLVGQTIIVPFDVLSQHMMMMLNPLGISLEPGRSRLQLTTDIMKQIYLRDGVRGFYRGYVASLCTYVPNSALWWAFYDLYQDHLHTVLPSWVSHLLIQCMAGTLGGFTTTLITNPLDIIRARLQVQRLDSMQKTFHMLWMEERLRMFTKGLSARLVQSACFSFAIILGYETIKRMSIIEEYREFIRW
ncbi:Solute carrier family 25 member 44 [Blattella germanica]|nr:Solute carrier family 25 member 44 [Blattella germanica]